MMNNREEYCLGEFFACHKGFYNDEDIIKTLISIRYSDFFEEPDDEEFPYDSAYSLLCGSCHIFALTLRKILNYDVYIIEGNNKRGFHAFCQIYRNKEWYYVDARGITTSFDEFMETAKGFVSDEYTIRPVSEDDIEEWKKDSNYDEEAYAFAEILIKKFEYCYTI